MNDMNLKLTDNVKKILYGLVRYPHLPDKEISNKLGIPVSTFSSIKKRLGEYGYYSNYNVPLLQNLGCELFLASYVFLNRTTKTTERLSITENVIKGFSEDFFIISEANQGLHFSISKNYTEFDKNVVSFMDIYLKNNFLAEDHFYQVAFPYAHSTVINFFDYSLFIKNLFNIDIDVGYPPIVNKLDKTTVKKVELTATEKKVFYGFTRYPDLPDHKLAEKIKSSRNTVGDCKRRFYNDGLMAPKRIPSLNKLGIKLLVFTYARPNPRTTRKDRLNGIEMITDVLNPILHISKKLKSIFFTPFRDFSEYQQKYGEVLRYYMENDFMTEEPQSLLFSVPDITHIKKHDYTPLVEKYVYPK